MSVSHGSIARTGLLLLSNTTYHRHEQTVRREYFGHQAKNLTHISLVDCPEQAIPSDNALNLNMQQWLFFKKRGQSVIDKINPLPSTCSTSGHGDAVGGETLGLTSDGSPMNFAVKWC